MDVAQRLKDSLPDGMKRRIRESRHRGDDGFRGALLSLDKDIDTIFDVGANIGNMSLLFLRWFPKATVYGFEPASAMFSTLNTSVAAAGFSDRFHGQQVGFFDEERQAELHLASHHGANSLMETSEAYRKANPHIGTKAEEVVELIRMDDFVSNAGLTRIDLVKIDVEGVEGQVLRGGRGTFKNMVDAVIMEISFVRHEREEGNHVELFKLMHELGFAPALLFDIEQRGPEASWRLDQVDCLFKKY